MQNQQLPRLPYEPVHFSLYGILQHNASIKNLVEFQNMKETRGAKLHEHQWLHCLEIEKLKKLVQ